MKLPFGLSLRDIIQDMIAGGAMVVVVWLAGHTPKGPSVSATEVLPYVGVAAASMVILHIIRYRQPVGSPPMPQPVVDQQRLEAATVPTAVPAEPMAVEAKATEISVPWSALRKELWDGVPNRAMGTSFALLDITIRPDLDKSVRDGTLEIRPTKAIRHNFMITAYLSGQELTFVDRPGEKAVIPVGDILPGGLLRTRLMVASLWPGGFEPEFSWFLHDSTGIERAAGKLSYFEYIQQRIRERTT